MIRPFFFLLTLLFIPLSLLAITVAEKTAQLNLDLEKYQDMEDQLPKGTALADLYYNLGNTYYQLQEYPWAILYYEKALALSPYDKEAAHHLKLSQKELSLAHPPQTSWAVFLSFLPRFSLQKSLFLFGICLLLILLLSSFYLWMPFRFIAISRILSSCFAIIFFCYAVYANYFAPIEGILVKASFLYKGAGPNYPHAMESPLLSGEKVTVIDLTNDGKWIKISTSQGNIGYIYYETFRLI